MAKYNSYGTFNLIGGKDIYPSDPYYIYDINKDIIVLPKLSSSCNMASVRCFIRGAYKFLLKDGNFYKEVSATDMEIYLYAKTDDRVDEYIETMDRRKEVLIKYINSRPKKDEKKFDAGKYGIHSLAYDDPCHVNSMTMKAAICSERRWYY